jgi:hypothetical protein
MYFSKQLLVFFECQIIQADYLNPPEWSLEIINSQLHLFSMCDVSAYSGIAWILDA